MPKHQMMVPDRPPSIDMFFHEKGLLNCFLGVFVKLFTLFGKN
ncbi:MAG: hypothetical protein WBD10_07230 [Acidobacteriaceae bacterium]